jgi:glycogen synthase
MWRENDDAVATLETPELESISAFPLDEPERLVPDLDDLTEQGDRAPILAIVCYEEPGSVVGRFVGSMACALAERAVAVHIFARRDFDLEAQGVSTHPLGGGEPTDLAAGVEEFANRVAEAFGKCFDDESAPITLLGHEWSAVPAIMKLRGEKHAEFLLSLHSLERQRSDMTSDISKWIEAIELAGAREAKSLLVHDPATTEIIRTLASECNDRIAPVGAVFPASDFDGKLDPGSIKAQYNIAPLDPVILYVGDLDERYGPDLLVKALPAVLKNHNHAKLIVVGEGSHYWPLRVYTRYLLLEGAVRLVGHVEGQALRELIQAADVVVVPSRGETPWWPIQAAWAAGRPVVASHSAAPGLLEHEKDSVLVYPSENSVVWGIERVWFDPALRQTLAEHGRAKLEERFGWGRVAALVQEHVNAAVAR